MPRFFLNLKDGELRIEDPSGVDMPDIAAAETAATVVARELMTRWARMGRSAENHRFEIADEAGHILALVPFKRCCGMAESN